MNTILVQKSRCVQVRNRHVACGSCSAVCPAESIMLTDKGPLVDSDKCLGCGACVAICPTEALALSGFQADLALVRTQKSAEQNAMHVVIACEQALTQTKETFDGLKVETVLCLALIDESFLVGLASHGVQTVSLACGGCETCPMQVGKTFAKKAVARATELLEAVCAGVEINVVDVFPDQMISEDTIAPFISDAVCLLSVEPQSLTQTSLIGAIPKQDTKNHPLHARKDGMLPRLRSFKRDQLLNDLWVLANKSDYSHATDPAADCLWPKFILDSQRCNGCQACVKMCVTGALEPIYDEKRVIGIEYFAGDCVQCGICEGVCPRGAVSFSYSIPLADVLAGKTEKVELSEFAYDPSKPNSMMEAMRLRLNCEVTER